MGSRNSITLNSNETSIYFKPYIFNSRDNFVNRKVLNKFILSSVRRLRSWKLLNCFLTTCLSATLFWILTFRAFLYIFKAAPQNFFNPHHTISMIYILLKCLKLSLIARKEIHQTFHASKYDIKQPSDASEARLIWVL